MQFFKVQQSRKRRSRQLYWLLTLSVILHTAIFSVIVAFILLFFEQEFGYWSIAIVFAVVSVILIISGFIEYQRTYDGGRGLAQRVGAVRLFVDHSTDTSAKHYTSENHISGDFATGTLRQQVEHNTSSKNLPNQLTHRKVVYSPHSISVKHPNDFPAVYQRYYEFSEQMAIASGMSTPILYVLPDEQGINGFVAGRRAEDMVMVLTQGALDKLSDNGLYGLIAHLYATIINGDVRLNMQILVMLSGMQLFYDLADPLHDSKHPQSYTKLVALQNERAIDMLLANQLSAVSDDHDSTKELRQARRELSANPLMSKSSLSRTAFKHLSHKRDKNQVSFGALVVFIISGSGIFWAKLIKYRFNRERELLADATSVQLNRSPAIMETLQSIHTDPFGSRLQYTPHIASINHFLFASDGADVASETWFSAHPSLKERMEAVDAQAYQEHARKVLQTKRINEAKLKQMYEQRKNGTWQAFKPEMKTDKAEQTTLIYEPIVDLVIAGRLQTQAYRSAVNEQTGKNKPLKPYQARRHQGLPTGNITLSHFNQINLPQVVSELYFHPLGAIAVMEVTMLCHQYVTLVAIETFGLGQIWSGNFIEPEIMKHKLNYDLFETISKLDRRMDSGFIELACKNLAKHNLTQEDINRLKQALTKGSYEHAKHEHYKKRLKYHQNLYRYQQGLSQLVEVLTSDKSKSNKNTSHKAAPNDSKPINNQSVNSQSVNISSKLEVPKNIKPDALIANTLDRNDNNATEYSVLWQALHFQMVVSALNNTLKNTPNNLTNYYFIEYHERQQKRLMESVENQNVQNKPSISQGMTTLTTLQITKLQLLALMLYQHQPDINPAFTSSSDRYGIGQQGHNSKWQELPIHLRRLARLIDVPFDNEDLVQSVINALVDIVSSYTVVDALGMVLYIKTCADKEERVANRISNWLSTFYTAMLSDGQLAQEEYDILTLLAKYWLGKRQLVE